MQPAGAIPVAFFVKKLYIIFYIFPNLRTSQYGASRMLLIYNLLFPLVFLFFLPGLIVKYIRRSGYKKTYFERFGVFDAARRRELKEWRGATWLHAVSVGETNLTLPLLKAWAEAEPDRKFVLSTTTTTAQEIARNKVDPARVKVIFCPIDWCFFVWSAMRLIRPSELVIFETELWPQMISTAKRSGAKLMLANTRISDHSFRGYRRFRFVIAPMLRKFDHICAQTELDRERLLTIAPGIDARISVCGNIKFDQAPPAGEGADFSAIFGESGITVLLAASTHSPEEPLILDTFMSLRKDFPALRLVLVPRHAERGGEIEKMIRDRGLSYHRRSNDTGEKQGFAVLLADTTGELARLIKGADLVIMGKTLAGNDEGQNIIEPAAMGKAVICGPRLKNFRQALDALVKGDAVCRIMKDDELPGAVRSLLADPEKRRELGERARAVMLKSRGALKKVLAAVREA